MKVSYLLLGMTVLVTMALWVGSSYAIDQRSIVAIYLFEEIDDGVLVDASENERDVPIIGDGDLVESADGEFGKALLVTRSTFAQLEGKEAEDFNLKTLTIMGWVNATGAGHRYITCKGSAGATRNFFANFNSSNELVLGYTGGVNLWNGTRLKNDRWYHFAGTYDGQMERVYVDGELGKEQVAAPPTPNDRPFTVGGGVNGAFPFNDCMVDELLIANVAFSQEDIQKIMNLGIVKGTGLFAVSSAGKLTTTWARIKTPQ